MNEITDPLPFWEAHDDPERPLDSFVLLCACIDCEASIRNEERRRPHRVICIKTAFDRIAVTVEYLVEAIDGGSLDLLLYVDGDYVREVYVPDDAWMPVGARWWSMTCHEDDVAAGRPRRRHRVAKRQSKAARRRRDEEFRAAAPSEPDPVPIALLPLASAIGPARRRDQVVVTAATEWSLAAGQPVDPNLIALICAAAERHADDDNEVWTRRRVSELLRCDIHNWCVIAGCVEPEGVPEAVWRFLGFLVNTGRLDPSSHPLDRLRDPLRCGGLDDNGHVRPPEDTSTVRCECNRPYHGPTLGQLATVEQPGHHQADS